MKEKTERLSKYVSCKQWVDKSRYGGEMEREKKEKEEETEKEKVNEQ